MGQKLSSLLQRKAMDDLQLVINTLLGGNRTCYTGFVFLEDFNQRSLGGHNFWGNYLFHSQLLDL